VQPEVRRLLFFVDSCDAVSGTTITTGSVTVNAIAAQYDTTTGVIAGYSSFIGGGQTSAPGGMRRSTRLTVLRTSG